jgi:hypothetical protein
MRDDFVSQVVVLRHASVNTTINGTKYLLESRVVQFVDASTRAEYRVLVGKMLIKDWTEGSIDQYFKSQG